MGCALKRATLFRPSKIFTASHRVILNAATNENPNALYFHLKAGHHQTEPVVVAKHLAIAAMVSPAMLAETVLSALGGQGATLIVQARKINGMYQVTTTKSPQKEVKPGYVGRERWAHLEITLALLTTALIVCVHWTLLQNAGGLWRDEINSVQVATLPTWHDAWGLLWTESFPFLPIAIFRVWNALGLMATDSNIRILGFIVGLVAGVLWRNAGALGYPCPTVALSLFGFNAVAIRFGDSFRGYGLGITMLLLAFPLMWKVAIKPNRPMFLAALTACVLATQSMYQNSFLLACLGLAGIAVVARDRNWKAVRAVLSIGAVCAASLLPWIIGQSKPATEHSTIFRPLSIPRHCGPNSRTP